MQHTDQPETHQDHPLLSRGHAVEDILDTTLASIGWLGVRTLLVGLDVRDRLKSTVNERNQPGHIPAQRRPGSTDAA